MEEEPLEKPPRNCHVVILTHEGEKQHEQTSAGMLTQFFVDNNNLATGVKTYVVDNAIGERVVTLQPSKNYCKKLCNVPHLQNVQYEKTPVMFIQCHGSQGSDAIDTPYLLFSPFAETNILYPCAGYSRMVWLHHVICETKLVFLMCCHCNVIVPEYLKERRNDFPDIVYFNHGSVMQSTNSILVGWLIKIIDSSKLIGCNPSADALYHGVKESVLGIMSMVRQCKDADEFLKNLIAWGCIAKYTTEKTKEEQELPTWRFPQPDSADQPNCMQDFYRLYGHTKNEYMKQAQKERLFMEFQTLTLLEAGKDDISFPPPKYTTHLNFPEEA
jgi:hypothetical protein